MTQFDANLFEVVEEPKFDISRFEVVAPEKIDTKPTGLDKFEVVPEGPFARPAPTGFFDSLRDPRRQFEMFKKGEATGGGLASLANVISGGKTLKEVRSSRQAVRLQATTPRMQEIEDRLQVLSAEGKIYNKEFNALFDELKAEELIISGADDPEFSMAGLIEAVKENPGGVAAEFINVIAEDPELALTPIGWERAAAFAAARTGVTAVKVAAGVTGVATVGGVTIGGISAAQQKAKVGEISLGQTSKDAGIGAAASIVLVGGLKALSSAIGKAASAGKTTPKAITDDIIKSVADEQDLRNSVKNVFDGLGIDKKITDEATKTVDNYLDGKSSRSEILTSTEPVSGKASLAERMTDVDSVTGKPISLSKIQQERTLPGETVAFAETPKITVPKKEAGQITPKLATAIALPAIGATIGGAIDGKEGAIAGAILAPAAVIGGTLISKAAKNMSKGITKSIKKKINVDDLVNVWEGEIAVGQRRSFQLRDSLIKLVKDNKRREAISHWLEGDKSIKLNPKELEAAKSARQVLDNFRDLLKNEGILDDFLENYVPHLWKQGTKNKEKLLKALEGSGGVGMALRTPHARQRVIPTLADGLKIGLEPVSLDIADILKIYIDNVYRVVQNRRLVNALKEETDLVTGSKLIMPGSKAPKDYVSIDHPALRKRVFAKTEEGETISHEVFVKVHPDIADHLKFVFDSSDPNIVTRGIMALNFGSKRGLVGMSLFHANALIESMIFAGRHPFVLKRTLTMLREGKAGDVVDIALKGGLKIGAIEDVGLKQAYTFWTEMGKGLVALTPPPFKGISKSIVDLTAVTTKKFDEILWDKVMTGGKLATFMNKYEKEIIKNAKLHKANPEKHPLIDTAKLADEVAEFTNDAFGGLNWRRMAQSSRTEAGRKVFNAIYSPGGRRGLQLAFFAPDWTIANLRVLLRGIIPGYAKSWRQQKLHLWYAMRGLLFYMTAGNLVNLAFSGKNIWENEDPTTVDMGDGRKMTISKQFVEPYHWVTDPLKTFGNKIGAFPRALATLLSNKRWISVHGAPQIWNPDDPVLLKTAKGVKQIGMQFVPISAQQASEQGIQGLSGFVGHPIYGKTAAQKRKEKREK